MARIVTVVNQSKVGVKVKVQTERERTKTFKERRVTDSNKEELFQLAMGGKVGVPIKGIPLSIESSMDLKNEEKLREYFENNVEVVYELNSFVDEGWDDIAPDSKRNFSLEDKTDIYYLSYVIGEEKMIRGPIQRSEDSIIINKSGIVEREEPESQVIKQGEHVHLQLEDGHFVTNPIIDTSGFSVKPGGVLGQTNTNTPGSHRLHPVDGSEVINSGAVIRICTTDTSIAAGRDNMQGTMASYKVYYVENDDDNQQKWRIEKVGASGPIKNGDKVKFVNMHWTDHVLTYNDSGIERYLSCQADYGRADAHKIWTIRKV